MHLIKNFLKKKIIYPNPIKINLITAVDSKWGISKKNKIPWLIKEDMFFFQDVTKKNYQVGKKNAIIMGKNTWKALPDNFRGLNDRINIVVSSKMSENQLIFDNTTNSDCYLVKNLKTGISLCNELQVGKIFIGGGKNIYKEALNNLNIDEIYLTKINCDFDCDNIFPYSELYKKLKKFKTLFDKDFEVNEIERNKKVNVKFLKLFRDANPMDWNCNEQEQQYLGLLENIIKNGIKKKGRNGVTYSIFGNQLVFDLENGFPILTTKKLFFRGVFEELLFFIKGDTNAKHLSDQGVKIWDPNTSRQFLDSVGLNHYTEGTLGPMYGYQWRFFNYPYKGPDYDYSGKGIDQLKYCIDLIKKDPNNRRILMTAFNPNQVNDGVLWPCHGISIIFNVENNKLSCMMTQRSSDQFLGSPFNICSYGLLVHMICEIINNDVTYIGNKLIPGKLIICLADTHIYEEHYAQSIRQILREPNKFPKLSFNRKVTELTNFKFEDLQLVNYQCYPNIIAKMIA